MNQSINGDLKIAFVGLALMVVYAYIVLSRRVTRIQSRAMLTTAVAFSVLLGVGAALGMLSAFGVPFTNMNQVLIYVLLGIGVDGALHSACVCACVWRVAFSLSFRRPSLLPLPRCVHYHQ